MKLATIILLSILSFSCSKNQKSNSDKNIAMNKLNTKLNIEQLKRPKLIGKWHSSYLKFDKKELRFYKERKNIKNGIESSFEKELEYEILASKENELNLKLDYILKSCYENLGGSIYID